MRLDELFIVELGLVVPGVNMPPGIHSDETRRQAAKLGFKVDANGVPPTWTGLKSSTLAKNTPNKGQPFYGKNGTRPNSKAPKIVK